MIAHILMALREQIKKDDQLSAAEEIAGPVPESPTEYEQILRDGGGFWSDVNQKKNLPEDLVLADAKRLHGNTLKVSTKSFPKQECKDAGERLLDLTWVDTDKSVDPLHKNFR